MRVQHFWVGVLGFVLSFAGGCAGHRYAALHDAIGDNRWEAIRGLGDVTSSHTKQLIDLRSKMSFAEADQRKEWLYLLGKHSYTLDRIVALEQKVKVIDGSRVIVTQPSPVRAAEPSPNIPPQKLPTMPDDN